MHLLDNVRAKLLHRKCTDVPGKLTNDGIAKAVVVQVKDVLNNLEKQ
jgi:hypothetical protein